MRTIKPIGLALVLTAALALLLTAAASARCLDLDDDCRVRPAPTRTLAPLWTTTPAAELVVLDLPPMSTDTPAPSTGAGVPAPPPATSAPSGYPGQPPTSALPAATVTSTPTATPPAAAVCALDWARPYSEQSRRDLGRCLGVLLNSGYPAAAVCPPADSSWRPYFSPPCPAP